MGGVLVRRAAHGSDTSFFGTRPMDTPAVEASLTSVPALVELFGGRVHIVSKAGPKIAALTQGWLALHGLMDQDMIPAEHVHFVRTREEKRPVCERLGITHFVDDRLDVLAHLVSVDHRYWFTGGLPGGLPPAKPPPSVIEVASWSRLVGLLHRDVERPR